MKPEIPLFYYPTQVAVVEGQQETYDLLSGQPSYHFFSHLSSALNMMNDSSSNIIDTHRVSILIFDRSISIDKVRDARHHMIDKSIQTLLLTNKLVETEDTVFDSVLDTSQKNFYHLLQLRTHKLQKDYFSLASQNFINSEMPYIYDDVVADLFDDICFHLHVKEYAYNERLRGFILSQNNGAQSILMVFNTDITSDEYYKNTVLHTLNTYKLRPSVTFAEGQSNYTCITVENIFDAQCVNTIVAQFSFSLH